MRPTRFLERASTYYHTVKYLSLCQVFHRLKLMALKRVEPHSGPLVLRYYSRRNTQLRGKCSPILVPPVSDWRPLLGGACDKPDRLATARGVLADRFTFHNETRTLRDVALWRCPEASQLWRYQVHYFDYTLDLSVAYLETRETEYFRKFADLVESWIAQNPPGEPDAWHPYPVSLRVVNWLIGYCLFSDRLAEESAFRTRFEEAIIVQLAYLADHLEFDVRGNHLLKNAKTLVAGGVFFEGPAADRWLKDGLVILEREAAEQIFPDGGHFERSLSYHLIVLQDYAEVCLFLRHAGKPVPASLTSVVQRMARFAEGMLHPDGDIPLFGDGELAGAQRTRSLLALAEAAIGQSYRMVAPSVLNLVLAGRPSPQEADIPAPAEGIQSYPHTGYFTFRHGEDYLAVDCGEACPNYLPAHAHADMLSYELALGERRFIVDAGTYEYKAGALRQHFRSTLAHNTVVVNGMEQSEAWGSFRLARRAQVLYHRVAGDDNGLEWFTGAYRNPYGGNRQIIHQRSVIWVRREYWVVVDRVAGQGNLEAQNLVLFAPACEMSKTGSVVTATQGRTTLELRVGLNAEVAIEQGWYSPHFGVKHQTARVVLRAAAQGGTLVMAYILRPGHLSGPAPELDLVEGSLRIREGDKEHTWLFPNIR